MDPWAPIMLEGGKAAGEIKYTKESTAVEIKTDLKRAGGLYPKGTEEYKVPSHTIIAVPQFEDLVRAQISEQGKNNLDTESKIGTDISNQLKYLNIKNQTCFLVNIYSRNGIEFAKLNSWIFKVKHKDELLEANYLIDSGVGTVPTVAASSASQYGAGSLWVNTNYVCTKKILSKSDKFTLLGVLQGSSEVINSFSVNRIQLDWN